MFVVRQDGKDLNSEDLAMICFFGCCTVQDSLEGGMELCRAMD
jgi:hypothetical protein